MIPETEQWKSSCCKLRFLLSPFHPLVWTAPRFEIKKWNAVTMWSWDICADTCAICRNNLNEPSIEYQVGRFVSELRPDLSLPPALPSALCVARPRLFIYPNTPFLS